MKKLMVTGSMLALMLVAAAPAFADTTAQGGDVDLRFVDASQTQAAAAFQTNRGDVDAGNLGSAAAIDQSLTIDQSQVNAGFGGVAASGDLDFDGVLDVFDVDDDNDGIHDEFGFFLF
jgi:hypothetical protein